MAGRDFRSRTVAAGHSHVRGFTLVELIVVMILMGILAGIAMYKFFGAEPYQVSGFAEQSRAILRFAQKEAIAQNRPVYARFYSESISLCFSSTNPCPDADKVQAPFTVNTDSTYCSSPTWYCIRRPDPATVALSLGTVTTTASRYISFDALGSPYTDSGTAFSGPMTLTVSAPSVATSTVTVERETGYVH